MSLRTNELNGLNISLAAIVSRKRLERGLKINLPEATAIIQDEIIESARSGMNIEEVVLEAQRVLRKDQVLEGVASLLSVVTMEVALHDGTYLVVVENPIK
jgi:urease gamma subunit